MRFFSRFALLSAAERAALPGAWLALWGFRLALWLVPFPRLRRFLDGVSPHAAQPALSPEQIGLAIARTRRLVPGATCLVQALGAQWLLRRHNHRSELHIGVVKSPQGALLAHAWVECQGKAVVGDVGIERFTRILRWEEQFSKEVSK